MITACVVIVDNKKDCLRYMLESLEPRASTISEILICDVDIDGNAQECEAKLGDISVFQFKYKPDYIPPGHELGYAHALGLHACIDRAKNDYIMFIDHDVIFMRKNFDKHFLDVYERHDLTFLGIEHTYRIEKQCYLNFPTVITALMHKSRMPGEDFLKDQLKYRDAILFNSNRSQDDYPVAQNGKFLIQTPIPSIYETFPNPQGNFDIGCNLWYWVHSNNGRWASFRKNLFTYSGKLVTNFGSIPDDDNPLLFHCGMTPDRPKLLAEQAKI